MVEDVEITEALEEETELFTGKLQVKEEYKFFHLPDDIGDFITAMSPHMLYMVKARGVPNKVDEWDIINNFVLYFLDRSKSKPDFYRWQTYDGTKGVPYFLWMFNQLQYFCLTEWNKYYKDANRNVVVWAYDPTFNDKELWWNLDRKDEDQEQAEYWIIRYDSEVKFKEFLRQFIEFPNKRSKFQKEAYRLYEMLKEGFNNTEMVEEFGISQNHVTVWRKLMMKLISLYASNDSLTVKDAVLYLRQYRQTIR